MDWDIGKQSKSRSDAAERGVYSGSASFMLAEGRAYSRRFVRPSVRPSHFCPQHISKSIDGNLMKLDTLIEGFEGNCRMQKP